jgi:hypothetical protein
MGVPLRWLKTKSREVREKTIKLPVLEFEFPGIPPRRVMSA